MMGILTICDGVLAPAKKDAIFAGANTSSAKSEFSATISFIPHENRKPIRIALSGAAPAAHFKRLYQKCSGRDPAPCSAIFCRSTSDRDLTYFAQNAGLRFVEERIHGRKLPHMLL